MKDVLAYAGRKWSEWFPAKPATALEPVVLAGGPGQQTHAAVFVFARGDTRPSAVLKVAFTPQEVVFLQQEFRALSEIRLATSERMLDTIPEPLGFETAGRGAILALRVVEGRRFLVPDLTRRGSPSARRLMGAFLGRSFDWSRELARSTDGASRAREGRLEGVVEEFVKVHDVAGQAGRRLRSFARSVARTRIPWAPCWQHGDVSVGNVLVHRGHFRFIDWEHAASGCEPWFDAAYAPGASVMLARRQARSGSVREVALSALAGRHWFGRLLAGEMRRTWQYPLPLPWAVALASMSTALRRERDGQVGWRNWADFALTVLADDEFGEVVNWLAVDW